MDYEKTIKNIITFENKTLYTNILNKVTPFK